METVVCMQRHHRVWAWMSGQQGRGWTAGMEAGAVDLEGRGRKKEKGKDCAFCAKFLRTITP